MQPFLRINFGFPIAHLQVVQVPYVQDTKTPVKEYYKDTCNEKRHVKTKRLVPVTKYKEVEETTVEVCEEEVTEERLVWMQVPKKFTYKVKKPMERKKVVQVPYTDYIEEECEHEVVVPVDKKGVQEGYRLDKKLLSKAVEVEQEEVYEMRPHFKGYKPGYKITGLNAGESYGNISIGDKIHLEGGARYEIPTDRSYTAGPKYGRRDIPEGVSPIPNLEQYSGSNQPPPSFRGGYSQALRSQREEHAARKAQGASNLW